MDVGDWLRGLGWPAFAGHDGGRTVIREGRWYNFFVLRAAALSQPAGPNSRANWGPDGARYQSANRAAGIIPCRQRPYAEPDRVERRQEEEDKQGATGGATDQRVGH